MTRRAGLTKITAIAFPLTVGALAAQAADIVETARQAGQFDRFVEAVEAAGLAETLKGEGPFTVFAPTDDAFQSLPDGPDQLLKREGRQRLEALLKQHMVEGEQIPSDSIPKRLEPMAGGPLFVTAADGEVTLRGEAERPARKAEVVQGDIAADNGVIHAIDAVLLTEELSSFGLVAGLPGTDVPPIEALREIPFEGALLPAEPPETPIPPMQKPLEPWVTEALRILYQRPMPEGPEPIPIDAPQAISVTGKDPVIQVLPGPAVFVEKLPKVLRAALPEESPFSNNVVELPEGEVRFVAIDRTKNDTTQSEDAMVFGASFTDREGSQWKILQMALAPLSPDPVAEPWFGGVATDTLLHGETGNSTPAEPLVRCALCSWGWADVWKDGEKVASSAPVHVMLSSDVRDDANGFRYACYDCKDNPVREIHVIIPPAAGLPTPGGFLHVMWENAEIRRGAPEDIRAAEEITDLEIDLGLDMPTLQLSAKPRLRWSAEEIELQVGQPVRLILANDDPLSFHAFMVVSPQGRVHVPLPHGSDWATSLVFDQPGAYEFWCPVGNHRGRGMHGRIIVQAGETGATAEEAADDEAE